MQFIRSDQKCQDAIRRDERNKYILLQHVLTQENLLGTTIKGPAERLANLLNKQAQKRNFEFLLLLLLPGKNATSFKKREVTI